MKGLIYRSLISLMLLGALQGCAWSGNGARQNGNGGPSLTWPSFPYDPRIQWVKEVRTPRDAGLGKGFWRRLKELVSGEQVERLVKPYGIYQDPKGRLFIADPGARAVHLIDPVAKKYQVLGGALRPFVSPIGVAGDGADNVFITDSVLGLVYRYHIPSGSSTVFLDTLKRPTGIAVNRRSRLIYITDTASHQVVMYDLTGMERLRIGGRGDAPGRFNYPTDISVDAAGDLYVTDALHSRVQIFSAAGKYLGTFGSSGDLPGYLAKPKGVGTDSDGNIYVCDAMQDNVQIFDRSGNLLLNFGSTGDAPGQFWMPSGIFIDDKDTIYVADSYNSRIQIFKYLKQEPKQAPAPPIK